MRALIHVTDHWFQSLYKGKEMCTIFFYLCKAFNSRFASRPDVHRTTYNFICTGSLASVPFCLLISNAYIFILSYNFLQERRNITSFAILLDPSCFYADINYQIVKP